MRAFVFTNYSFSIRLKRRRKPQNERLQRKRLLKRLPRRKLPKRKQKPRRPLQKQPLTRRNLLLLLLLLPLLLPLLPLLLPLLPLHQPPRLQLLLSTRLQVVPLALVLSRVARLVVRCCRRRSSRPVRWTF